MSAAPSDEPMRCPVMGLPPTECGAQDSHYGGLLATCQRCGLTWTSELPEFEYEAEYFETAESGGYDFQSPYSRASDEARFGAELDELSEEGLAGTVLDFGCATGEFLRIAKHRGWTVAGVEISEAARRGIRERLDLEIAASLEELPAQSVYEVVTLHHVLEHLPDPVAILEQLRPRVGRRLRIEVPNYASVWRLAQGTAWTDLRPEQHIFHYTPRTLVPVVERAGYRILRCTTLEDSLWAARSGPELLGAWWTALATRGQSRAPVLRPLADGASRADGGDGAAWAPPTGLRAAATQISRLVSWPLVRATEAAGRGRRLVIDAEPLGQATHRQG